MVKIRFERNQHDKWSQEFGPFEFAPFEFAQLTYDGLRVGPDGAWLANWIDGFWRITNEEIKTVTAEELEQEWSDVVIYTADEALALTERGDRNNDH